MAVNIDLKTGVNKVSMVNLDGGSSSPVILKKGTESLASKSSKYIVSNLKTNDTLNIRSGPGTSYSIVSSCKNGYVLECSTNLYNSKWRKIASGKFKDKYVSNLYLKAYNPNTSNNTKSTTSITHEETTSNTKTDSTSSSSGNGNYGREVLSLMSTTDVGLEEGVASFTNTFGAPFLFTKECDPCYYTASVEKRPVGRAMIDTLYSNPSAFSVFSICPGKVNYLPGLHKQKKDDTLEKIKNAVKDSTALINGDDYSTDTGALSGDLYEFSTDYSDYMNRLNVMARVSSIMLGIGDEYVPGTKIKFRNYDYSYYSTAKRYSNKGETGSSTDSFLHQIEVIEESVDSQTMNYIHFFLTTDDVTVSDSHSITTGSGPFDDYLNGTKLNDLSKAYNYLFNGTASDSGSSIDSLMADVQTLMEEVGEGNGSFVKSFSNLMMNFVKGGRMVVPDMIESIGYESSVNVTMTFRSLYGNKISVFLETILPSLALLNFCLPKQMTNNMYGYPYIVRCFQRGSYNSDLAVIGGLEIKRGGSDNIQWTVDGLATEIDVSFNIVPLYSSLMGGSGRNPFLFMENTAMLEYLGNLCGMDLNVSTLQLKANLYRDLTTNFVKDTASNLVRKANDEISDKVRKLFQFN